MNSFVFDSERKGSCYHEFYKGQWDNKTFWKEDSISLHDDILFECPDFVDSILDIIPNYDYFGETEISYVQWKQIGEVVKTKNVMAQEIYSEADSWLIKVFEKYPCFTILGI